MLKKRNLLTFSVYSEAVETRHALHGVTWPSSNPKCLNVDFGKEEDMEKAIVSTMEEQPRLLIRAENRDAKEEKEFGWSKDPLKSGSVDDRSKVGSKMFSIETGFYYVSYFQPGPSARPVREWDVGKNKEEFMEEGKREKENKKGSFTIHNRGANIEDAPGLSLELQFRCALFLISFTL